MDSNITSLPPDPHASHADAASRPRAALPGEDTLQSHGAGVKGSGTANPVDGTASAPATNATPKHRGRTVLLTTSAVLVARTRASGVPGRTVMARSKR